MKKSHRAKYLLGMALIALPLFSQGQSIRDNQHCGIKQGQPLSNAYGPFDSTNPQHRSKLGVVLKYHFNDNVRRLQGKRHSSDLDYTLRAIPNYHQALYAVSQYEQRGLLKGFYNADCYFKRALYFQPKDAVSYMLFGMHLQATKRLNEAKKVYQRALKITPTAAELNYNYGLLLFELGEYNAAEKAAQKAYQKGYPLNGLKNKLASVR
ncbi:tetratricopeptide repeat protein [Psychrobium sp. 1_MG-2023]|uniref:tetratricopeptide repeat protein n=1 Tax=Psychrobium sp. 1_MG-2023 TaxID=3062624 RepID=UPI002733924C|nr:tetratricopeptide repeat protein [Psychrobium sp. 1_MG-2023]MDP2559546.1 tetratricopeptide repeat protein [Psychrobium sp. 1_MG-2023]